MNDDETLRGVGELAVLQPDAGRSERVRGHCRARLAQARPPAPAPPRPRTRPAVHRGLAYALSIGYFAAMVYDVLRVYFRR